MLILSCSISVWLQKGVQYPIRSFVIIEKWRKNIDNKDFARGSLDGSFQGVSHSKQWTFDRKIRAYGFRKESLTLLLSYLSNRWQRNKINTSFSSWTELLQGLPQVSVPSPFLFNIYLNDLFFFLDCNVRNCGWHYSFYL